MGERKTERIAETPFVSEGKNEYLYKLLHVLTTYIYFINVINVCSSKFGGKIKIQSSLEEILTKPHKNFINQSRHHTNHKSHEGILAELR